MGNTQNSPAGGNAEGEKSSTSCLLVNETDRILVFRDKVGTAYGKIRYTIEANSQLPVDPPGLNNSGVKMLVYANPKASNEGGKGLNTNLLIHTDQIRAYKKIIIQSSETSNGIPDSLEFE